MRMGMGMGMGIGMGMGCGDVNLAFVCWSLVSPGLCFWFLLFHKISFALSRFLLSRYLFFVGYGGESNNYMSTPPAVPQNINQMIKKKLFDYTAIL